MSGAVRLMGRVVDGYERATRLDRRRRPVEAVDRELRLTVRHCRDEAHGVRGLTLARPDGGPLPAWHPGAHLDLLLPSGRLRQYSLCGDPAEAAAYRIAVRRIDEADGGRGGSAEVHRELREGSEVRVRGVRNAFPLIPAGRYCFIAGGIGITPILPMVRAAAAAGVDYSFVYCGRSRESMPFLREIEALEPSRVWVRPDTEYGIPANGREVLSRAAAGATVYCCGPPRMISGLRMDLPGSGAGPLHFERFSAPPIVDGREFEVELARTGEVLRVPADRSALEVILRRRPDAAYSCRQGFCGSCAVGLRGGPVEHRDRVLTPGQRAEKVTVCVSRAAAGGRLVLDL